MAMSLPAASENEIKIYLQEQCQRWVFSSFLKLPAIPVLALDTGRSNLKGAYFSDQKTMLIKKLPTHIQEFAGSSSDLGDFFGEELDENSGYLSFEMDGITYTVGADAAYQGGGTELGKDKSHNIRARVVSLLMAFGVTGDFAISISVTYESMDSFRRQEAIIHESLSGTLHWSSNGKNYSASPAKVFVVPESSLAHKFPAIFSPETYQTPQKNHLIIDGGYQTGNAIFYGADGRLQPTISGSSRSLGGNIFYADIAARVGCENPEDPDFIDAVNYSQETIYLPEKRRTVALLPRINEVRPVFVGNFINSCLESIRSNCRTITLSGGMMHLIGTELQEALEKEVVGIKVIICPAYPEYAQVVAQAITFLEKIK